MKIWLYNRLAGAGNCGSYTAVGWRALFVLAQIVTAPWELTVGLVMEFLEVRANRRRS